LLLVRRGVGEARSIRHLQRAMKIGALMQEVYNLAGRGLDRRASVVDGEMIAVNGASFGTPEHDSQIAQAGLTAVPH
jgi:hypothetical protein